MGERGKLSFLKYEHGYLIGPGEGNQKKKVLGGCQHPSQDCSSSPGLLAQYLLCVKEKDCGSDSPYFTEL